MDMDIYMDIHKKICGYGHMDMDVKCHNIPGNLVHRPISAYSPPIGPVEFVLK